MKKTFLFLIISIIIVMCTQGAIAGALEPVASSQVVSYGTLESYPQFPSRVIEPRNVTVWLPQDYKLGEPCDVLYMHDGQMLFDATATWNKQEWQVDEVLGALIAAGKARRCIVVGVDNTSNRLFDYFPTRCFEQVPREKRMDVDLTAFKGDEYLQFLVQELKPFIDSHYRPLTSMEHTFVMGSSMGGLISLYAMCEYPWVFGGAVCMSTHVSMMFPDPNFDSQAWSEGLRNYVEANMPNPGTHLLYMDRGSVELDDTYAQAQSKMDAMLKKCGWNANHFVSRVFEGHKHMETYWAERLDTPLLFILGK